MEGLSPRVRRAVALGLLFALTAVAAFALAVPLWRVHVAYDARHAELSEQLQRFTHIAQQRPALERRRAALRAQGGGGYHLSARTEALAAAELQRAVKLATERGGGVLLSTQALRVPDEQGFQRIAVRVHMRGTLETVRKAFHTLETDKPFLFLEDVKIRALNAVPGRHRAGTADLVDVNFELYGYRVPAAPTAAEG